MLNVNTESTDLQVNNMKYDRAAKWKFYWLCGLVIAFAYERPLAELVSFDRLNPRLFDVFFFLGLIFRFSFKRKIVPIPKLLVYWKWLVVWFCICAIVWSVAFLPLKYAQFSLFLSFQYMIGLVVIFWAINIPITEKQKKILMLLAVGGGVFVSIYCIPEYFTGRTELVLTNEKIVFIEKGTLLGPFGSTYFHIIQYQVLAFSIACVFGAMESKNLWKIAWGVVAIFISWPLFFCGSRTGLLLIFLTVVALFLLSKKNRMVFYILSVLLMFGYFFFIGNIEEAFFTGRTYERLIGDSKGFNSVDSRLSSILDFDITSYKCGGLIVPFFGGGFYVAPVFDGVLPYYRVDYGVHNIFLFVFEQSGIFGLFIFLLFIIQTLKILLKLQSSKSEIDCYFSIALFSFFIAVMFAGITGQIFWRGFGTGNFNTYLILMLCIASLPTDHFRKKLDI